MNSQKKNVKLRGQTLVEFALIIPLFVLIVMFIFDIGRAVYFYSAMYSAVREGARAAAVLPANPPVSTQQALEQLVVDRAVGLGLDVSPVAFDWSTPGIVVVEVPFTFRPITPLIGAFLPGGKIEMEVQATMRLEFSQ